MTLTLLLLLQEMGISIWSKQFETYYSSSTMIPLKKFFKLLLTCVACSDCGNTIHGSPAGYAVGQPLCGRCVKERQ